MTRLKPNPKQSSPRNGLPPVVGDWKANVVPSVKALLGRLPRGYGSELKSSTIGKGVKTAENLGLADGVSDFADS